MHNEYHSWLQTASRFNREEAWPARQFPDAQYRYFRDAGCLVCALAVMLERHGLETADAGRFDPWILNRRLIGCGAFSSAADLEISVISKLYPLEYLGAAPYTESALHRIAGKGVPCLITVPGTNAQRHFTAFLRLAPEGAVVFDPLCGERTLDSLAQICEVRTFRFTGNTAAADHFRSLQNQ